MKILIITDYAGQNGGIEFNAWILKNYFIEQGHECMIFSSKARDAKRELITDYQTFGTTSRLRTYSQAFNVIARWDLKRILKQWKPDVVHLKMFLTQLSPSILPILKPYKTVFHIESYREICLKGTKLLPNNNFCTFNVGRECFKNKCILPHHFPFLLFQHYLFSKYRHSFHKIVTCSDFVKQEYLKNGFDNIETVWNGLPEREYVEPVATDLSFNIVFVGRLVFEKGVTLLLKALARVIAIFPLIRLEIYGDGTELLKLKALCNVLGLEKSVFFMGYVANDILEKKLTVADLQVVPSVWNEPFGYTVIEAMRRGTPVLATKVGGIVELISDDINGLLAAPNEEAMAERILYFFQHPGLKSKFSIAGKVSFKNNFTIQKMGQKLLNIFN